MMFSIIVCSHERSGQLIEFIKSSNKLSYKNFETIVIDSSKRPISKKFQKMCSLYLHRPELKPVCKKKNLAASNAKGDILIFTDDDCELDKKFLKSYEKAFLDKDISVCTGRAITHKDYKNELFDKCFNYNPGEESAIHKNSLFIVPWKIGNGNNIAFRKNAFKDIGGWDENMGPGTDKWTSEDADLIYRTLKKGYIIKYVPEAVVYHKVENRDTIKDAYLYGTGGFNLLKKHKNLDIILLYFATIFILLRKSFFSKCPLEKKVWLNFLKGWLGFRFKNEK
jgi:GT2 family glycosyltransferase